MSIPKILLPYNFASLDQKAVSFAIQMFKQMEGADITVFHTYTPLPGIEIKAGRVTEKMISTRENPGRLLFLLRLLITERLSMVSTYFLECVSTEMFNLSL